MRERETGVGYMTLLSGYDIGQDFDSDIDNKISKFNSICGTIRNTLRRKTTKETQMEFYKVMALPTVLYGSENWVPIKKNTRSPPLPLTVTRKRSKLLTNHAARIERHRSFIKQTLFPHFSLVL
ncbi:hypothetical protein ANN_11675 [Periplaneta americana]|uniref:Uncharacterized protein n=1 Tax=Periplaneta americana TaxID=6978 RepID=A0ABQ8T6T7_PERAM|nr:hypothetical protein ANN_11675 [Periplaneta americana]